MERSGSPIRPRGSYRTTRATKANRNRTVATSFALIQPAVRSASSQTISSSPTALPSLPTKAAFTSPIAAFRTIRTGRTTSASSMCRLIIVCLAVTFSSRSHPVFPMVSDSMRRVISGAPHRTGSVSSTAKAIRLATSGFQRWYRTSRLAGPSETASS